MSTARSCEVFISSPCASVHAVRRWHHDHPDIELRLVRHNSSTGGLAEGLCDLAVIRSALDLKPWSHAFVGHEDRYLALASDDPWARRRSIRPAEVATRTLALDRRTGTTTLNLWPETERPAAEHVHDIDDWLAAIASGRCVGVTPQATVSPRPPQPSTAPPASPTTPCATRSPSPSTSSGAGRTPTPPPAPPSPSPSTSTGQTAKSRDALADER